MISAQSLAEALASCGLDPGPFLEEGLAAAQRVAGHDEEKVLQVLSALQELALQVGSAVSQWALFRFGVRELAQASDSPERLFVLLRSLQALASAMDDQELELERCLQQGVAVVAQGRGPLLELLQLGVRLAERGVDPRELLRHVGPALAWADVASLEALERFAGELQRLGVGPYWPVFVGVAAIAHATGEPLAWASALSELTSLVSTLVLAERSVYPVLEYGVAEAFGASAFSPWLLPEILPLAVAVASHGHDPQPLLQRAVPALCRLDPPAGERALELARQAADDGIDPAPALYGLLPAMEGAEDLDEQGFAELLRAGCELLGVMASRGVRPWVTFEEAWPCLWGQPLPVLERAMAMALSLARAGRDPGPALRYGLVSALQWLQEQPLVRERLLEAAQRLADDGLDPWGLLEWGSPALAETAASLEQRLDLLARLEALVRALAVLGADPRHILLFTVHQPARAMRYDYDRVRALVDRVARAHEVLRERGLDPSGALIHGLPRVAETVPGALELAFTLTEALAVRGLDPGPMLSHALPALVALGEPEVLFEQILRILDRLPGLADRLARALPSLAGAAGSPRALAQVLEVLDRLVERGVDALEPLASLLGGWGSVPLEEMLAVAERELGAAAEDGVPLAGLQRTGLGSVAELAQGRADVLQRAMGAWRQGATALLGAGRADLLERGLLDWGTDAALQVADGEEERFVAALGAFVRRTRQLPAELDLDALFRSWLSALVEGSDPELLDRRLGSLLRLAVAPGHPAPVLEATASLARVQAQTLEDFLTDLCWLWDSGRLQELEDEGGLAALARLQPLCEREPTAWRELLLPALQAQRHAASDILRSLRRMEPHLVGSEALSVLRAIITQEGVRVPQLLDGFLAPALALGIVRSLSQEREQILAFLREVPVAHPEYYRRYAEIVSSPSLSAAERRAQIEALHSGVLALTEAIVQGELSPEALADPLLPEALFHVFPPACSVTSRSYLEMVRWFPDHPEHTARFPQIQGEVELAVGAYQAKPGERVELGPWQPLLQAVRAVHEGGLAPPELGELGALALEAWTRGELGQRRDELLRGLYAHHHPLRALPAELGEASALLSYREFLADSSREILHDALRALRLQDPERYEQQVGARLARRVTVGRGLLRATGRTLASWREGTLSRQEALQRLGRQLRGFLLSDEGVQERLLQCEPSELPALLQGLQHDQAPVALGEEHLRILADLTGQELAAMQHELFGDAERAGKLEYRRAPGGPTLRLRLQISKRRAHAPIGYCEGVCTAGHRPLWDDERFLQCLLWGPEGRARGGMHLWVVDGQDGRHLALPGLNPSLQLMGEVGAEAVLDAMLAFARQVCARWELDQVLVPTSPMISSNRGALRELLAARGYPQRSLPTVPFPYPFDSTYVVS
jgi:hypothetical protein